MKLYYAGTPGEGYGWGTCNRYLIRELSRISDLTFEISKADAVFMPLADHDLSPISPARGKINLAFTFFEYPLGPKAAENAAQYDVVFCGSTWCLERMRERGITNGKVLIQGVDFDLFHPCVDGANTRKEFRIFSGGKFEHRKGQDIVIAAFRELLQKGTKDTKLKLVTAWWNPWPGLIWSMEGSPHIRMPAMMDQWDQVQTYKNILRENGIPMENVEVHGQLSQPELASVMNSTDLGVFPNRCEGGTNLVLMEYMACGKPVVASAGTGHADLRYLWDFYGIDNNGGSGWHEMEPAVLAEVIDAWRFDGTFSQSHMNDPIHSIRKFTWERAARQIVDTAREVCEGKADKMMTDRMMA